MSYIITPSKEQIFPQDWYPKEGYYFRNFIDNLPDSGFDKEAKEVLVKESLNILGNCPNPKNHEEEFQSTGAVIGYVQSGKTTSFMSVVSAALDNGYNLIIVLGGRNTPLYQQNAKEFREGFNFAIQENKALVFSVDMLGSSSPKEDIRNLPLSYLEDDSNLIPQRPIISVILKHQDHIGQLTKVIRENHTVHNKIKALVIDDEADSASLNALVHDCDETAIYHQIRLLRKSLPRNAFLQYTATPQAILLTSRKDHYSPEWARIITPGTRYVGTEELFNQDSPVPVTIPPADIITARAEEVELPDSLLEALRTYLLTAAQSLLTPDIFLKKVTMMVHPAREVVVHKKIGAELESKIKDWKSIIDFSGPDYFKNLQKKYFLKCYKELKSTNKNIKPFNDLLELVPKIIKFLIITTLNADSDNDNSKRRVDWDLSKFHLIIGGDLLDRGFVVKGLVTTYMPRSAGVGNSDTIQQRGRFYGYKKDHLGFLRAWLNADTKKAFKAYLKTEKDLYERLKNFSLQDPVKPLSEWVRSMILSPELKPCRKSVISIDLIPNSLNRSGWFWTRKPLPLKKNRTVIEKLINSFENDFKPFSIKGRNTSLWTSHMKSLIAKDLHLRPVIDALLNFETDPADEAKWSSIKLYLGFLKDQGYKCSLILIGTQSINFDDFAYSSYGKTEFSNTGLIHQGLNAC